MRISTDLATNTRGPVTRSPAAGDAGSGNLFVDLLRKAANLVRPSVAATATATPPGLTPAGLAAKHSAFRGGLSRQLDEIGERLREALDKSGIDLSQGVKLEIGSFGGIQANQHPQSAEIEKVFEQSPELRALVHIAAANQNFLQGQTHSPDDFSVTLSDGELRFEYR